MLYLWGDLMKNVVIGTAGHIDHGKTTLIRALTGRNTDTLQEEIKRGISINLGFTYFDLPSGKRAGIVDVPGHERFIKNMIAGAYGIDIVLLTIAATESVKPQTIEHADIISFLGIKEGLIVMTKCDMADEIMRELVADDIKERLKGTFFENKEIVMIDSISGFGLDHLIEKIDKLTEKIEPRNIASPTRMNIDRVFTSKGFGTIVTGTLIEGKIFVNDELNIYHCETKHVTKTKIKNIQIHEKNVPSAYAGQRTALNLANVKASELMRGDILAAEDSVIHTAIADAQFSLTKNTKVSLKMWDRVRIYTGAREILARFVPLGELEQDAVLPGESGFCQLRFEKEIYLKKGDPFVMRRYSPMETIGGGKILDPAPRKRRRVGGDEMNAFSIKSEGSTSDIIEEFLKRATDKMTVKTLSALTSIGEEETKEALIMLMDKKIATNLNGFYFHINTIEDFRLSLVEKVADFHNKFGLKPGISKEELRSKTGLPIKPKEFDALLQVFSDDGTLKIVDNIVSLTNFSPQYTASQQKIYNEIEKSYLNSAFMPPPKSQFSGSKVSLEVFDSMVPKTLICLDDNNFLHINHMNSAKEMIRRHLSEHKTMSLAEFRDMTNSSRKYCLLILEYFDSHHFTRRDGETRRLY